MLIVARFEVDGNLCNITVDLNANVFSVCFFGAVQSDVSNDHIGCGKRTISFKQYALSYSTPPIFKYFTALIFLYANNSQIICEW